jgi:hypothetical protein
MKIRYIPLSYWQPATTLAEAERAGVRLGYVLSPHRKGATE